jgi:hypothetical protein
VEKPIVVRITEDMARPFVYDYCQRWGIPFDRDEGMEYGQAVLWVGSFYKGSLRAVIGLLAVDPLPDEVYIYGFYGDGTVSEKRPLRALVEFLFALPYKHMFGFVHEKNTKMVEFWEKYNGKVLESYHRQEGDYKTLHVRGEFVNGRKIKPGARRRTASVTKPDES